MPAHFFDRARAGKLFGDTLTQGEVDGCNAILAAMTGDPMAYVAYALATAYEETWHTMQPIAERGGDAYFFRMYDPGGNRPAVARALGNTQPGDGARFRGRGYVQLTGRALYARAGAAIGVDLIARPELALDPDNAAAIMRRGMDGGWFTGVGFSRYLPDNGKPAGLIGFTSARKIINGQDCASEIARYAMTFQEYLA